MREVLYLHVNNHTGQKSYSKIPSSEKKRRKPSYTIAGLVENGYISFGVSICSPSDNFCKEIGRRKALEKAMSGTNEIKIPEYMFSSVGKYFVIKAKKLIK